MDDAGASLQAQMSAMGRAAHEAAAVAGLIEDVAAFSSEAMPG